MRKRRQLWSVSDAFSAITMSPCFLDNIFSIEKGRRGLEKTKERVVQTDVHLCLFKIDSRIPILLIQLDTRVSMEF